MAGVKYDESWVKRIHYGGPPIDWDLAWNYFEGQRRQERALRDPAVRLLLRVQSPEWGSRASAPGDA